MKAFPVPPAIRPGEPGRGFHTGGTFPMRRNPDAFQADLLGRPTGFSRVHLVDSSVFPSLPATTITLSVMANAHRIGSTALD
jgi:choline dehydrogenase-like flavoprotein